jgi:hypothetical protein
MGKKLGVELKAGYLAMGTHDLIPSIVTGSLNSQFTAGGRGVVCACAELLPGSGAAVSIAIKADACSRRTHPIM